MTEDEYIDLLGYMYMQGYNVYDDDDILDAIVVKDAYVNHYTDAQLERLLGDFKNLQKSY